MYSNLSKGALRLKFLMFKHMYVAPSVLRILFCISLDVVRSAVHVESLPG
jgi:hypothetical protein